MRHETAALEAPVRSRRCMSTEGQARRFARVQALELGPESTFLHRAEEGVTESASLLPPAATQKARPGSSDVSVTQPAPRPVGKGYVAESARPRSRHVGGQGRRWRLSYGSVGSERPWLERRYPPPCWIWTQRNPGLSPPGLAPASSSVWK